MLVQSCPPLVEYRFGAGLVRIKIYKHECVNVGVLGAKLICH